LVKFGGPCIESVVKFCDHLEYFTAIWYNLLSFGIVCGHFVYFFRFGMFWPRKIRQPCGRSLHNTTRNRCYDLKKSFRRKIWRFSARNVTT
jgi:hypothetical protein